MKLPFMKWIRGWKGVVTHLSNRTARMSDHYLGSEYRGNYVWGGAMTLAWQELTENILHEKLRLNTNDKVALEMAERLNHAPFTRNDLDGKSYYIKAGFGQKTVDLINEESRVKFPAKSFEDLQMRLGPTDIISYAYFLKEIEYLTRFKEKEVQFRKKRVKGFHAINPKQRENIQILRYWNDNRFIISLRLKDDADELFLAKGFDRHQPAGIVNEIVKYNNANLPLIGIEDQFEMPKLHLQHRHDYIELMNKFLANRGFEQYFIAEMFENIKFDMDHKGARVEDEAIIRSMVYASRFGLGHKPKIRRFILDKPFWVVMKRKESQYPYFVLCVKNKELMQETG